MVTRTVRKHADQDEEGDVWEVLAEQREDEPDDEDDDDEGDDDEDW